MSQQPQDDARSVTSSNSDTKSFVSSQASTMVMAGTGEHANGEKSVVVHTGSYQCCTCTTKGAKEDLVLIRAATKGSPLAVFRCKACHAMKSRLNRIMSRRGTLAKDWENMSETDRSEFIKNNNTLYGRELETKVTDAVMLATIKSSSTSFTGTGDFKTEEDLRRDWAHAPHVADNIIANGRKFHDDVKGVMLYEDVKYQSKQEDQVSNVETRKMKMESGPHQATVSQTGETGAEGGNTKRRRKGVDADGKKEAKEQQKKDTDLQQLPNFQNVTFNLSYFKRIITLVILPEKANHF